MTIVSQVLIFGSLAGLAIPLGALLSRYERIRPTWLQSEIRHGIAAFGAGALLVAVALVLVPDGIEKLSLPILSVTFFGGGIAFAYLDWYLAQKGTAMGQFVAMLADFVPECLALGAMFITYPAGAILLAVLIALQNLPEAFNAYREFMEDGKQVPAKVLLLFALLAPVGPLAAYLGVSFLSESPQIIAMIMVFAAGGILYLMFQELAPQVPLKNSWLPPLGALLGFFVGILGSVLID
jgi:ZIP family zinc transporter